MYKFHVHFTVQLFFNISNQKLLTYGIRGDGVSLLAHARQLDGDEDKCLIAIISIWSVLSIDLSRAHELKNEFACSKTERVQRKLNKREFEQKKSDSFPFWCFPYVQNQSEILVQSIELQHRKCYSKFYICFVRLIQMFTPAHSSYIFTYFT